MPTGGQLSLFTDATTVYVKTPPKATKTHTLTTSWTSKCVYRAYGAKTTPKNQLRLNTGDIRSGTSKVSFTNSQAGPLGKRKRAPRQPVCERAQLYAGPQKSGNHSRSPQHVYAQTDGSSEHRNAPRQTDETNL